MLADIPESTTWDKAPVKYQLRGGYGDAIAMADKLYTLFNTGTSVMFPDGWGNQLHKNATLEIGDGADGVIHFFESLSAIERPSVAAAFAAKNHVALRDFIAVKFPSYPLLTKAGTNAGRHINALLNAQQTVGGVKGLKQSTALNYLQAAIGFQTGFAVSGIKEMVDTGKVLYDLVKDPQKTFRDIEKGIKELVDLAKRNLVDAVKVMLGGMFPEVLVLIELYGNGNLVSFKGGYNVGLLVSKVVREIATQVVGAIFTGGTLNVVSAATRIVSTAITTVAKVVVAVARVVGKAAIKIARPVLSAARRLIKPLAVTARAGASLVRGVGRVVAKPLAKRVVHSFSVVARRATNITNIVRTAVDARIPWSKGIKAMGLAWEDYLAKHLPAGSRLPTGFKTFDFFDRVSGVATSAKVLTTTTPVRLANPKSIYNILKKYIDAVAIFDKWTLSGVTLRASQITSRELRVAVPRGMTAAQWVQIREAVKWGRQNGVRVIITVAK